jgi:hypothetical protein
MTVKTTGFLVPTQGSSEIVRRFGGTHRLRLRNRRTSNKPAEAGGNLLVFRLAYSLTLNVEAIYSFEMLRLARTTRRYNPDDRTFLIIFVFSLYLYFPQHELHCLSVKHFLLGLFMVLKSSSYKLMPPTKTHTSVVTIFNFLSLKSRKIKVYRKFT